MGIGGEYVQAEFTGVKSSSLKTLNSSSRPEVEARFMSLNSTDSAASPASNVSVLQKHILPWSRRIFRRVDSM